MLYIVPASILILNKDWHGHVVAEETAQGIPITYLGIHFPASDIPPQVTTTT